MAERVDVCIVGSGFGGSIAAWRLAELYRAADVDPKSILVLERGPRFKHTDFKQSMYIGHLSNVYSLIQSTQGTGAQIVVANGVGGGSNLYLAASIRSPTHLHTDGDRRDQIRAPHPSPRASAEIAEVVCEALLRVLHDPATAGDVRPREPLVPQRQLAGPRVHHRAR